MVPAASCRLASCEVGGSRILGREFGHLAPASSGVRRIVTPVQSASHIQGHRYDRFPAPDIGHVPVKKMSPNGRRCASVELHAARGVGSPRAGLWLGRFIQSPLRSFHAGL